MSERIPTPDIKVEELLRFIDSFSFEDREHFIFNGSSYYLILRSQEDVDSDESREKVFFAASTRNPGEWDIYLLETLTGEERRRMIFHEVLECNLIDQGFSRPLAHQLARRSEEETFGAR